MTIEALALLIVFAVTTSITPGPNNLMLLASGANFGLRRTLPHLIGITAGFLTLLLGVGFGLDALLIVFPRFELVLKIVGGAYLLYLAWRIAMTRKIVTGEERTHPLTFLQAAAFQWVNPKAWFMAISAMSLFTSTEQPYLSVVLVAIVFALANLPCFTLWAAFGLTLRGFLVEPVRLKWFNIVMGLLLVATLILLLLAKPPV